MGVLAILATLVILAYAVLAVSENEQACEHSQAYGIDGSASDTGKDSASDNSVLKRCVQPPSGCIDETPEGVCSLVTDFSRCVNGKLIFDELCGA